MELSNAAVEEASGRPQRAHTLTAKMMEISSSGERSPLNSHGQVRESKVAAATNTEDGIPVEKSVRGRPRKNRSITPANRWISKEEASGLQAQTDADHAHRRASAEPPEANTPGGGSFMDLDALPPYNPTDQLEAEAFGSDLPEPHPNSNKAKPDTVKPDTVEPNTVKPNTVEPEIPDLEVAATKQSQSVSCDASSESSESSQEEEAPPTPPIWQFGTYHPTVPVFRLEAAQKGESGLSKSPFASHPFPPAIAIKRAPTAQNQHLWRDQASAPQIPQIIVTAASDVGSTEEQEEMCPKKRASGGTSQAAIRTRVSGEGSNFQQQIEPQQGEMNAGPSSTKGGGMSAAPPAQQNEQIGDEAGAQGAENGGNRAIPGIPDVKVDGVRLADVDEFLWHFAGYVSSPHFHSFQQKIT
jgi:hypothetical protein